MRENEYNISNEKTLKEQVTALKNLAKSYELRLRGMRWDTNNEKWVQVSKAFATSNVIDQSVGMITSFAETVNLMTTKNMEKYIWEFSDAFYKCNGIILNDEGLPAHTHRAVLKMYKDTLSNIGDIIVGSREVIKKIFEHQFEEENSNVNF